MTLIPLLSACGFKSVQNEQASIKAAEDSEKLNFALHDMTANQAYLVVANPNLKLKSVSICVGTKAECGKNSSKTMIATIPYQNSNPNLVLFKTKDRIDLKQGVSFTAVAATESESSIMSEIKLVASGKDAVGLTYGTGGRIGFNEYSFTASNGKKSIYKYTAPADAQTKAEGYGLLIYLHGDLGADYGWFYDSLVSVAQRNNLLPVAVRSPTVGSFDGGRSGPTWWQDGDRNAVFFDELLKKDILARFNIDTQRVYYTGASGGPTFLSGPWLNRYGHQYRGGAILFCGGVSNTGFPYTTSPGYEKGVKLTYYNGDQDFLLGGAQQAIRYYKTKGFDVYSEFPVGIDHCGFSAQMGSLLNRFVKGYLDGSNSTEFNLVADSGIINPDPKFVFPQVHSAAY